MADELLPPPEPYRKPLHKRLEKRFKLGLLGALKRLSDAPKKGAAPLGPESKVLFIRLHRIGDALITTPLLKAVHDALGCEIHVLADRANGFIFEQLPFVRKVWLYEKQVSDFWRLPRALSKAGFDALVDTHDKDSTTVAFLLSLTRAPHKFGLDREGLAGLYTCAPARPADNELHPLLRVQQLQQCFGLGAPNEDERAVDAPRVYFPLTEAQAQEGKAFREKMVEEKVIAVNISAGSEARFWGVEKFVGLIGWLRSKGYGVYLLRAPKEHERAVAISAGVTNLPTEQGGGQPVAIFTGANFASFASAIKAADLLFTPDTSAVHLASAYGVPVFGLYVQQDPQQMIWYAYGVPHAEICTPYNHLKNITAAAAREQLAAFLWQVGV